MDKNTKKGVGDSIVLYQNKLCIRRGFRMYVSNRELLESPQFSKWRPSDILHEALSNYFLSILTTPIEKVRIPNEKVNRAEVSTSRLYIELENNAKINDLAERGFTVQAIINHALSLYLNER
jgi:hypothetical protein